MTELLSLALLGFFAIIAPLTAKISKIPCVVIEIVLGMLLGRTLFNVVDVNGAWTSFLFDFGLIYLLFLAGLEIDVKFLRKNAMDSLVIGSASTLIPFALGYVTGALLNADPMILGAIFSTTSVGIVLPAAKEMEESMNNVLSSEKPFSKILIGATTVSDMGSMLILAFIVQSESGNLNMIPLIFLSMLLMIPSLKAIRAYSKIVHRIQDLEKRYHFTTRLAMILMIVFAALAEAIGVHAVVGSFFAGILVSELTESSEDLLKSLTSFGYALFLPMFFLIAGAKIDLPAALHGGDLLLLPVFLVLSFVGKLGGTYAAAIKRGLGKEASLVMGTFMWAKLSLTIAAAEAGLKLGMIDIPLYSTLIVFALLTVVLAPIMAKVLVSKYASFIAEVEAAEEVL